MNNTGRQLLLLLAILAVFSCVVFFIFQSVLDGGFNTKLLPIMIICILPITGIIFLAGKTKKEGEMEELKSIFEDQSLIEEWKYTKDEWDKYAINFISKKKKSFIIGFSIPLVLISSFILYVGSFIIAYWSLLGGISIVLLIYKLKFSKLQDLYLNIEEPGVKITTSGFVLNSKKGVLFNGNARLSSVRVENYLNTDC